MMTGKSDQENITARALKLRDMVDYQTGAVVSRTLIDKKSGTVTLFSFDVGQGLSEHTAPFDAMVIVIDGEAEIIISGKSTIAREGDMVIMPANQTHAIKAPKQFKIMLVMIRA